MIGSPASISAWRFVPSPLTSTPIIARTTPPDHGPVAGLRQATAQ